MGSGRGASVREKNITKLEAPDPRPTIKQLKEAWKGNGAPQKGNRWPRKGNGPPVRGELTGPFNFRKRL